MRSKIQKWGNSQGIRLAKGLLEDAHIHVGDEVNVIVRDGVIEVVPAPHVRGKYCLEDLTSQIPKDYEPQEENWGDTVGREVW